jgi:hypothetical protein
MSLDSEDTNLFAKSRSEQIPSIPTAADGPVNSSSSRIISAGVVGGLTYLIAPNILGIPTQGIIDEEIAASAAVFTYFVSGLRAPKFCAAKPEQQSVEKLNILKGTGSGVAAGFGAAATLKILADIVYTGGLMTISGILAGGGAALYNQVNKTKYCLTCKKKDSCSHIVCRHCLHLHVPKEKPLDCSKTVFASWYDVASQLHYDGLNYPESLEIISNNMSKWRKYFDSSGQITAIDCNDFNAWRQANPGDISSYRGKTKKLMPAIVDHIEALERAS